jgi:hypothetical protein
LGLNDVPIAKLGGSVAGLAYFVPKPDALQVYALINGEASLVRAMFKLSGVNDTDREACGKAEAGLAYFVPNPAAVHG